MYIYIYTYTHAYLSMSSEDQWGIYQQDSIVRNEPCKLYLVFPSHYTGGLVYVPKGQFIIPNTQRVV